MFLFLEGAVSLNAWYTAKRPTRINVHSAPLLLIALAAVGGERGKCFFWLALFPFFPLE
jgi:hypothetical protein